MSDDEITGGLDLLGDWLDAKGYGEEAGLCTRAMDLIHKQADEITRLRADNERLRRLVERIVEHHEHDESEVSGWTQWEALVKDARAAIEGVTEKSGAGNE